MILLIITNNNQPYAQDSIPSLELFSKKLDSIEGAYRDSLKNLDLKIVESDVETTKIKRQIEEASITMEYLNSVVGSFEIIFAILGIFIAVLTIIIPFATYQYAVKPSREALEKLEDKFDARLKEYLSSNRNDQIEKALENIESGSSELKHQGISFLTYIQNEGLTEHQLFKVYNVLRSNLKDNSIKGQLAFILSSRKSIYAKEMFNGVANLNDPVIKQMAIIYFAKTNYKENYEGIENILRNSDNQQVDFHALLLNFNQYSSSDVEEILNDKKIVDLLKTDTLIELDSSMGNIIKSMNGTKINLKKSYLSQKIKGAIK